MFLGILSKAFQICPKTLQIRIKTIEIRPKPFKISPKYLRDLSVIKYNDRTDHVRGTAARSLRPPRGGAGDITLAQPIITSYMGPPPESHPPIFDTC